MEASKYLIAKKKKMPDHISNIQFKQYNCWLPFCGYHPSHINVSLIILSQETLRTMMSRVSVSTVALRRRLCGAGTGLDITCATPADSTPR